MSLRFIWVGVVVLATAAMAEPPAGHPAAPPGSQLPAMHFDHALPQEAFGRLAKEAGVTLSFKHGEAAAFWAAHAEPITRDISPMPYWEALHELCLAAKVSARASTDQEIILEEPTPSDNRQFAVVHGLIQIELQAMVTTQLMSMSNTPTTKSVCQLAFRCRTPVGLKAMRCEPLKINAMVDQDDKPIKVSGPPQCIFSDDGTAQPQLFLERGPGVKKIKRIAGELTIGLRGQPQTLASVAGPKGTMLVFFRSADW